MPTCKICKTEVSNNSIRLGVCWDCAEAESIISTGLDMFNKGDKNSSGWDKLKLLLKKGWKNNYQRMYV